VHDGVVLLIVTVDPRAAVAAAAAGRVRGALALFARKGKRLALARAGR
jgi:hypothetical protein